MGNYTIGFSITALILYLLQLFPNIIWMIKPPANNTLSENRSPYPIFNVIEGVFGISTVALLILVINKAGGSNYVPYIALAILFLAMYYAAWISYFRGLRDLWVFMVLAAAPPFYFLFIGLWMNNFVVLAPCVIFGMTHIGITWSNYAKS